MRKLDLDLLHTNVGAFHQHFASHERFQSVLHAIVIDEPDQLLLDCRIICGLSAAVLRMALPMRESTPKKMELSGMKM